MEPEWDKHSKKMTKDTNIWKTWTKKEKNLFFWGGGTLNLGSPHEKNRAVPLRPRTLGKKNINYFRDLCTFKHGYPTLHIFWLPWMNKSPWQPHNAITLTFIWVTSLCNFPLTALPRHSRVLSFNQRIDEKMEKDLDNVTMAVWRLK